MNGVDEAIVARANELVSLSARGQNLVAACARMSKAEEAILEKAVGASPLLTLLLLRSGQLILLSVYRSRLPANF
jgi:hypothetical protein